MAKKIGPKEQQLKDLREKAEQPGLFDPSSILAEIEQFKATKVQPIKDEINKLQDEREKLDTKISGLQRVLAELTGRPSAPAGGSAGGKFKRRSKEEQKADADAIHAFIKASGKDGVSGADIRGEFQNKAGQSVKDFLKVHGHEVTTDGVKVNMRYYTK